jgi:hypothetical protein
MAVSWKIKKILYEPTGTNTGSERAGPPPQLQMIPVRIQPQRGEPRGRKLWAIGHDPRCPHAREHQA